MSKQLLILCLLFITGLAHAQKPGYVCTVVEEAEIPKVAKLSLAGYSKVTGKFPITGENCGYDKSTEFRDACNLKGHTVLIQIRTMNSVLISSKGEQFALYCDTDGSRPSHGGSN